MKFLIIGDVHGVISDFAVHVRNVMERGIDFDAIIQCGDFEIYPGMFKTLKQSLFKLKLNKPIYHLSTRKPTTFRWWDEWLPLDILNYYVIICSKNYFTK